MPRVPLTLSAEQRRELEDARDHDVRPYFRERCAGILKVANGITRATVAATGLLRPRDQNTVGRWVNAYRQDGLAGLVHKPRGHRGYSPRAGRTVAAGGPGTS
jgi:hypothetical protein